MDGDITAVRSLILGCLVLVFVAVPLTYFVSVENGDASAPAFVDFAGAALGGIVVVTLLLISVEVIQRPE